jgi:tetratricopeptide (TPR) repeat protein
VHPVLTEAVTNIVGRADMLAAFGVLGAVVAYHHSLRREGLVRTALLAAIALATTIGVFSKESGIVAVAAVVLYDQIFARGVPWSRRIPGWLAVIAPAAVFLLVRWRVLAALPIGPFPFTDNPIVGAGFVEGRMTALQVIAKYLMLLLWPARLSPDYSYNQIPVRVNALGIAGLVLCVAAAGLAVWAWRKHRALTFAIALFFVAIAPVSNIFLVIGSIMGERFLYLPAVGFAAAVVYGLNRLWTAAPQRRNVVAAALGVVLLALAARAYARNADWNDDRQFWEAAVAAAPGSFKPRISILGSLPRDTPEGWRRVLDEAHRALGVLDPLPDDRNAAFAYRAAGVAYRASGDSLASSNNMGGAMQMYQLALGVLLRSERIERKLDEQYRVINKARGIAQSTFLPAAVYRELGITYLKLNQLGPALQALEFGHGLEADPDLLENLALAYGLLGDVRKGVVVAVEALEVDSKRTYLADKLLATYKLIDPSGCPVRKDAGGESLNIECPMVHDDICTASRNVLRTYLRRNQTAEAASIRRVAVEDLRCAPSSLE